MMGRRRGMLAALAGGALAWALPETARGAGMKRLAPFVSAVQAKGREEYAKMFEPHGFRSGQNLEIRWFEFPNSKFNETIPPIAARLVEWNPHCITTGGEISVSYLRKATSTIPIVVNMWYGDPVDLGWAKSLARPGGNITGTHNGAAEVNLKRMQLLKALVPSLSCVGWIAFEPNLIWFPTFERAAHAAGLRVRKVILREAQGAFEETKRQVGRLRSEGCPAAHFHSGVPAVVDAVTAAARESRLVLSYSGDPAFADREGILFIYEGQVQTSGYGNAGRLAAMVARILRGERPADISFEGPTGYHLKLNLRTAARIGVSVPLEMRVLANEVV